MTMRRDRFAEWWDAQPEQQTCRDCGKEGRKAYIQPQQDGGALCIDCIAAHNARAREARKAQLAAAPRCEVPGCRYRGAWRASGVLLCGRHLKRARAEVRRRMAGAGALALFLPGPQWSRAEILNMARHGTARHTSRDGR